MAGTNNSLPFIPLIAATFGSQERVPQKAFRKSSHDLMYSFRYALAINAVRRAVHKRQGLQLQAIPYRAIDSEKQVRSDGTPSTPSEFGTIAVLRRYRQSATVPAERYIPVNVSTPRAAFDTYISPYLPDSSDAETFHAFTRALIDASAWKLFLTGRSNAVIALSCMYFAFKILEPECDLDLKDFEEFGIYGHAAREGANALWMDREELKGVIGKFAPEKEMPDPVTKTGKRAKHLVLQDHDGKAYDDVAKLVETKRLSAVGTSKLMTVRNMADGEAFEARVDEVTNKLRRLQLEDPAGSPPKKARKLNDKRRALPAEHIAEAGCPGRPRIW